MKPNFIFALVIASHFTSAQNYTVGTQMITYTDPARGNRAVGVEFRYPGTNSALLPGPFPFVIFAHGFQMDQVPYYPYADTLAKQGYIVGLLTTETALLPSHPNFAQDLIFVYNKLIAESNANSNSPFYQKVIPRGAIGGHSMGGGSTVLSSLYGNPAVCYFTFGAATTNPSSISAAHFMTKPYLSFAGSRDCIAPVATHQQPMYDSSGSACKFLINITDGLHCQFGSGNFQCNFGEGFSGCASSPLSRADQINKTLHFLVPYLNYYLKGDCNAWTLFESRYTANTADVMQRSCTNAIPYFPYISGDNYFCNGSSTILTANPPNFSYLWSDQSTDSTISVSVAGNYSLVVGNGVCSLPAVSVGVTENFAPVLTGNISGLDTICFATDPFPPTFSVSPTSNLASYTWTLPLGWTTTTTTGDTSIMVNAGSSGIISVFASNACGNSDTLFKHVTIGHSGFIQITQNNDTLLAPAAAGYQWYLDGALIPGADSQIFIPALSGDYSVNELTVEGCALYSNTITFTITDVINRFAEEQLQIFPNPNSLGKLEMKVSEEFSGGEIRIFDVRGIEILKLDCGLQKTEINISILKPGFYVLSMQMRGKTINSKLIVE